MVKVIICFKGNQQHLRDVPRPRVFDQTSLQARDSIQHQLDDRRGLDESQRVTTNLLLIQILCHETLTYSLAPSSHFKFDEIIQNRDLNQYHRLNDYLYLQILYSTEKSLEESRKILECIEGRKLFKYVGSTVISKQLDKFNNSPKLIEKSVSFLKFNYSDCGDRLSHGRLSSLLVL